MWIKSSTLESTGSTNQSRGMCHLCHIPYQESQVPFPTNLMTCAICHKGKVPDVLFMTIEPCDHIPITGYGTLIQARVCRSKRECKGETCAKEISDVCFQIINYLSTKSNILYVQSLPFLEYELHRQLLTKLKIKGMNALFNISIQSNLILPIF